MIKSTQIPRAIHAINNENSIAIILPEKPMIDSVLSGVSLYLSLLKMNKAVSISCSGEIPREVMSFKGVDKISKQLGTGGDNLVVSFPYTEGSIDKVTYNIENGMFNLIIAPREGFEKLDPAQVKYSYSGAKIGLLITIDAPNLESLGLMYESFEDQFKGKEIINIDRHLTNANYGTINIVERQTSSLAEIIFRIIEALDVTLDKDIATGLYSAITSATNNFTSYSVNADTFEISSKLLKAGAVKKPLNKSIHQQGNFVNYNVLHKQSNKSVAGIRTAPFQRPYFNSQDSFEELNDYDNFSSENIPQENVHSTQSSIQKPTGVYESGNIQPEHNIESKEPITRENAPQDWLKPKIFRGNKGMV